MEGLLVIPVRNDGVLGGSSIVTWTQLFNSVASNGTGDLYRPNVTGKLRLKGDMEVSQHAWEISSQFELLLNLARYTSSPQGSVLTTGVFTTVLRRSHRYNHSYSNNMSDPH